jgi:hypothetical protein
MRVSITEHPAPGMMGKVVAVVDFKGELTVAQPNGGHKVWNPGQKKEWGFVHGSVPKDVVEQIYEAVCRNEVIGTAGKYKWRQE